MSKTALFSFALVLGIFSVWGLFGSACPSSALPFTINVASKLVAFAAVRFLFLPQRAAVETPAEGNSRPGLPA